MKWCDRSLVTSPVAYRLCKSEKEFRKTLRAIGHPKEDHIEWMGDRVGAITHFFDGDEGSPNIAIVSIDAKKERSDVLTHTYLCHEGVHIWQAVRETLGEFSSIEFEAYAIQSITQNLIEAYHAG